MKKYILRGVLSGRFYVTGRGFTAATAAEATRLTESEAAGIQECGRKFNVEASVRQAAAVSYAVCYVRPEDLAGGSVRSNRNNPSSRRFATRAEAWQHGTKAPTREASKDHAGFYVVETNDPVNAEINWQTGLTNAK